jgi:hypothetical protein
MKPSTFFHRYGEKILLGTVADVSYGLVHIKGKLTPSLGLTVLKEGVVYTVDLLGEDMLKVDVRVETRRVEMEPVND